MEGEENKLTTFPTWTIMSGCNESNIIFQQHLCKLGQLRRSNGKYSQVLGQAMRDQLATTRSIHTSRGRDTAPTTSSRVGSCIVDSGTLHCSVAQIPGRRGAARAAHAQFYHGTVRRMTKTFVQRCQSIYVYIQSMICE